MRNRARLSPAAKALVDLIVREERSREGPEANGKTMADRPVERKPETPCKEE